MYWATYACGIVLGWFTMGIVIGLKVARTKTLNTIEEVTTNE